MKIEELYAYFCRSSDGRETIAGYFIGDYLMALVGSRESIERQRAHAQKCADETGETLYLVKFTTREDVETINPVKKLLMVES